jgi:hypothetical protein
MKEFGEIGSLNKIFKNKVKSAIKNHKKTFRYTLNTVGYS